MTSNRKASPMWPLPPACRTSLCTSSWNWSISRESSMVSRNFMFAVCALAVILPPVPAAFCQAQKHIALDRVVGAVGQVLVSGTEGGRDVVVEGSGVIVSPAGLMVTSYHVVRGPSGNKGAGAKSRMLFNPADPSRVD